MNVAGGLVLVLAAELAAGALDRGPVLILHATVIDATGAPAKPDTAVLVQDGRIAAIGPAAAVGGSLKPRVVDARGKFLIPGLWDMHVHVSAMGEPAFPVLLARGITGLRDMGSDPDQAFGWRARLEQGALVGPRLVSPGLILDGPRESSRHRILVATRAEGAEAVGRQALRGADLVKVHSWLSREAYLGVAEEARRRGQTLAGHVPPSVSAWEALEAGHASVEHIFGLPLASSTREADLRKRLLATLTGADIMSEWDAIATADADALDSLDDERMAALSTALARRRVVVCPTLAFYRRVPPQYPWAGRIYRGAPRLIAALRRAGVLILAGTDLAAPPEDFDLHTELAALVEAGLTPMDALQAATRNAAASLGRSDALGTIEVGKRADLVLLEADPLSDIRNTRKVDSLIRDGRLFSKQDLRRLAGSAERAVPAR